MTEIYSTRVIGALAAGALSLALSFPAHSANLGNPDVGKAYAETHCASCHAITRDSDTSRVKNAAPFQVIADTDGMTRTALYVFFRTPHRTMPNLIVTGDDVDNVIAYILSLKTPKRQ